MNTSEPTDRKKLLGLTVAALGVVYGDIGTSPLYAFKESLHSIETGATPTAILGILSLILWALILIVSVKYILFIMRTDHRGEGGILALVGQLFDRDYCQGPLLGGAAAFIFTGIGIFGAALLYGDGMITPAISVLSAVEGIGYAAPQLQPFVVPTAIVILLGLFIGQRFGTARVGNIFGPAMLVWFSFLALVGLWNLLQAPEVLQAINPLLGLAHLRDHGFHGFLVLGSVFLAVTGSEALFADLGHFGRKPIRLGWHSFVLPALALNYFGQGAAVLRDPAAGENPFYAAVPEWALYPAIGLATVATVVASQALISGAFSLTLQAIYLGYCPRLAVRHTSHSQRGQVYVPDVNWGLMVACIALVLSFQSSAALASAYGIAVALTMFITTVLFTAVSHKVLKWPLVASIAFGLFFGAIELSFVVANGFKIVHGGWLPLVVAAIIFLLMTTWKQGRTALFERLKSSLIPFSEFLASISRQPPPRVQGCAIFLSSTSGPTPLALLHNLRHNKVLHETVILLSVRVEMRGYLAAEEDTIEVQDLGQGFYSVVARYGYMETPNVPLVVSLLPDFGVPLKPQDLTYFLSRERIVPAKDSTLGPLRRSLFAILSRNSASPADFFCLPPGRVVELGVQVEC